MEDCGLALANLGLMDAYGQKGMYEEDSGPGCSVCIFLRSGAAQIPIPPRGHNIELVPIGYFVSYFFYLKVWPYETGRFFAFYHLTFTSWIIS